MSSQALLCYCKKRLRAGVGLSLDMPAVQCHSIRSLDRGCLLAVLYIKMCPCHVQGTPAFFDTRASEVAKYSRGQTRAALSTYCWLGFFMQVMLAQQESIAHLMTLYEAVRKEGQGSGHTSQPQLQAVKQESSMGKACLKQDRSACHTTQHVLHLSQNDFRIITCGIFWYSFICLLTSLAVPT